MFRRRQPLTPLVAAPKPWMRVSTQKGDVLILKLTAPCTAQEADHLIGVFLSKLPDIVDVILVYGVDEVTITRRQTHPPTPPARENFPNLYMDI